MRVRHPLNHEMKPFAADSVPVYLDNQATTRLDPRVLEAMLPCLTDGFGNAASIQHRAGQSAAAAVGVAREQVAELIGADRREIILTSGATESNNLAIKGLADSAPERRRIITSPTEHPSVLEVVQKLNSGGFDTVVLPVDRHGVVDLDALRQALGVPTLLVSVMAANNEIGTLGPIDEIGRLTREHGALFHCDAAQAVGKLPIDVDAVGIDLLSLSAHKMYGPKGAGALYVRRDVQARLAPIFEGGGHENGLRSGTVNVPGAVGLGAACAIAGEELKDDAAASARLRDELIRLVCNELKDVRLNGHPELRLPGNANLLFPGIDAEDMMLAMPDVAVASGSACSSASPKPSHVLLSIGRSYEEAQQSIRFGIGRFTTVEDIIYAAHRTVEVAGLLRQFISEPVLSTAP
jgi:cysteine desulfurase